MFLLPLVLLQLGYATPCADYIAVPNSCLIPSKSHLNIKVYGDYWAIASRDLFQAIIYVDSVECGGSYSYQSSIPTSNTTMNTTANDTLSDPQNTQNITESSSSKNGTSPADLFNLLIQAQATWNLARISQRSLKQLNYYFSSSQGADVDCYVLDSGVDINHPDFQGRAVYGANFVPGEGPEDLFGHGTHVAGIIASSTYGAAKQANIIAVKILDKNGLAMWPNVLQGLQWTLNQTISRNRKAVVNLSIGGTVSTAIDDLVRAIINAGVPVVVAAGNNGLDACSFTPSRVTEAIVVAASDSFDTVLDFPPTNIGKCVNLFAPGDSVKSTYLHNNYLELSGTSMAAPHVAGVLALWLAEQWMTPAQLEQKLLLASTPNSVSHVDPSTPNLLIFNNPPQ